MDVHRIDLVLRYALTVAGELDLGEREVTATQLVKYVYLADLAYAARAGGETFTGAPWRFHHFGPYAPEVQARVEPVVRGTGAMTRTHGIASSDRDITRYSLRDSALLQDSERELPVAVAMALRRAVRSYRNDLPGLLHDVYRTRPMLNAAPNELLSFTRALADEDVEVESVTVVAPHALSTKQQRRRKAALDDLRARVASKLEQKRSRDNVTPDPPPRYDEVFADGVSWIDANATDPINAVECVAIVGDSVWKSGVRSDDDIS